MRTSWMYLVMAWLLTGCVAQQKYNPSRKFGPDQLQSDYRLFRAMLEESHPSLYWYTSRDSMDHYFEWGLQKLQDSLTEAGFRNVLSYVVSHLRCGHTAVRPSKQASGSDQGRSRLFPLNVKVWDDTVMVTSSLNRRDTNISRGDVIKSIDGRPINIILDSLYNHLPSDGYNMTHKYQSLSNSGVFRNMYGAFFGLRTKFQVEIIDSTGKHKTVSLGLYNPASDTGRSRPATQSRPLTRKERKQLRLHNARNLKIDTAMKTAFMEVNTFTKHNRLRSFFRRSFRTMKEQGTEHLVVDMRGNGGGSVTLSNLLTKYIAQKPFKIADSLYAVRKRSNYGKYIDNYFWNRLFFIFLTSKEKDGNYHFRMFENKYFDPKENRRFNGEVYILTGGNTFSAATLFTKALKEQDNVTVIGEETGGGAYGNTAWLIPDVTLPNTKVRFRLPLFRLVIDKDERKGRGLIPEVESKPTSFAIRRGIDFKMLKAIRLIQERN